MEFKITHISGDVISKEFDAAGLGSKVCWMTPGEVMEIEV